MNIHYKEIAEFYDMDTRSIKVDDIEFYKKYSEQAGGNILELGCGTGRIIIKIADICNDIYGLDISDYMLDRFKVKMKKLDNNIKNRINIIKSDMSDFNFNKRFNMIYIPFRTFQSLTNDKDAINCLNCVYKHLNKDGIFIINVFKPFHVMDESWIDLEERENWKFYDKEKNLSIKRTEIRRAIDINNQVINAENYYYVKYDNKTEQKFTDVLYLKYYYESQIKTLLQDTGFDIIEEFGYYDKRKLGEGSEIILVCKKR